LSFVTFCIQVSANWLMHHQRCNHALGIMMLALASAGNTYSNQAVASYAALMIWR